MALSIITFLFFIWGFITCLGDVRAFLRASDARSILASVALFGLLCSLLIAQPCFAHGTASDLNHWIDDQYHLSWQKLLKNISPADGIKGSVVASPSRVNPNYYFHWVRDAALATSPLIEAVVESPAAKMHPLFPTLLDYIRFAEEIQ